MNNRIGILQGVAIVIGALLILLFSSAYIVYQPEQAIVLQFGEPIRVVNEAGLKFKVPFVQNVVFYDSRLLNLDPPAQEVVLNDKKRLDVESFTRYRIINPLQFYQTVRTEEQARSKLAEIVNSSLRKVLGRVTLAELLSQQRTQIMADISAIVKKDAEAIGVSVADVRIRRADLPREVMQAINDRMKTERQRDAKEFRAKGQQQAQNIRATADKEATIIVAEAEKNAQITRGEGDKQAVELWNRIVGQDVEFYDFYRSLDAYRKSLSNEETSLVLSPDSDFFKYFNKSMWND